MKFQPFIHPHHQSIRLVSSSLSSLLLLLLLGVVFLWLITASQASSSSSQGSFWSNNNARGMRICIQLKFAFVLVWEVEVSEDSFHIPPHSVWSRTENLKPRNFSSSSSFTFLWTNFHLQSMRGERGRRWKDQEMVDLGESNVSCREIPAKLSHRPSTPPRPPPTTSSSSFTFPGNDSNLFIRYLRWAARPSSSYSFLRSNFMFMALKLISQTEANANVPLYSVHSHKGRKQKKNGNTRRRKAVSLLSPSCNQYTPPPRGTVLCRQFFFFFFFSCSFFQ